MSTLGLDSKLDVFPAFHRVKDRRVLVVGSGEEAAAKVRLLSETKARIVVVGTACHPALGAAIEAANAQRIDRSFRPADLDDAVLVFAATGEHATDALIVEAARRRGVPANAVDRPELCDFYTPALVNRAPLAVAITTTGAAPVFARRLRARIEAMLPLGTGAYLRFADALRSRVAAALSDGAARRRFWSRFFDGRLSALVDAGDAEAARREAEDLIAGAAEARGYVWLVGAGPGAEDLLTLRAQRVLQEADVIFHDALVPAALIAMGRRDAERVAVGKRKGCHAKRQEEINTLLVEAARSGKRVVRLKSGDPLVFGRAGEELDALKRAGVPHEIVPGITAAVAAAADLELPLTLRGVASSLVFTTGHDMRGEILPDWARLAASGMTVAIYMGRSVAGDIAARLIEAGLAPDTLVAVVENASRPERRALVGTLADLPGLAERDDLDGPTLVIVGEAVAAANLKHAEPLIVGVTSAQRRVAA